MNLKLKKILIGCSVIIGVLGYHVCKDIFKIGIKDGKQTALNARIQNK